MKTVRAAVAVVRHGDEVLVVRAEGAGAAEEAGDENPNDGPAGAAKYAEDAPARWGFPAAELHRGESPAEACARGVHETLAFEVRQPSAFYTIEYNSAVDLLLSVECFFCELGGQDEEGAGALGAGGLGAAPEDLGTAPGGLATAAKDLAAAAGGLGAAPEESQASPPADAAPNGTVPMPGPRLEARWVARGELASLAWEPVSRQLARVLAASDADGDQRLIKRRADSRKSMQGNKRANTKPELLVRQRLREAGLPGYRLQWKKAPGRPDIAYPGRKVAIFVNGCFWHRCPLCHPPVPKRNREFWEAKFDRNVERDARVLAELEKQGWSVITIWECELKKGAIDATMERVVAQVRAAQPSRPRSR